jgi:hypothetical protein
MIYYEGYYVEEEVCLPTVISFLLQRCEFQTLQSLTNIKQKEG